MRRIRGVLQLIVTVIVAVRYIRLFAEGKGNLNKER